MSITIQSPDGKYLIDQHDDYGETAMGSPAFDQQKIANSGVAKSKN